MNRAAREWGGAEEDGEVKGVREGDVLVTQGGAALPSAWTCLEGSWPQMSLMLLVSRTQAEPHISFGKSPLALGQTLGQKVHSSHSLKASARAARSLVHMVRGLCAVPWTGSLWYKVLLSTSGDSEGRPTGNAYSALLMGIAGPSREWLDFIFKSGK